MEPEQDGDGNTIIHRAVAEDDTRTLQVLLEGLESSASDPCDRNPHPFVNVPNKLNQTALHLATRSLKATILLCKHGVEVNAGDSHGNSVLHYIDDSLDSEEIIKVLTENGADVNARNARGKTPLHAACIRLQPVAVRELLLHNADCNSKDDYGFTPLHYAVLWQTISEKVKTKYVGLLAKIMRLATGGFSFAFEYVVLKPESEDRRQSVTDEQSKKLNKICITKDEEASLEKLGKKSLKGFYEYSTANDDQIDYLCCRLLHVLLNNDRSYLPDERGQFQSDVVKELLDFGADVNAVDCHGRTAFHMACATGHHDVAYLLVTRDTDIRLADQNGTTKLHEAAAHGCVKSVEFIVDVLRSRGDRSSGSGKSQIDNSSREKTVTAADFIDACDEMPGESALHKAVYGQYFDIVEILIESGADVNIGDSTGYTPLHLAVDKNDVRLVQLLLEKRANPNKTDISGNTPLFRLKVDSADVCRALLASGAEVNAANLLYVTPLHMAVSQQLPMDIIIILYGSGANVLATDQYGNNILHNAFPELNEELVKLFINARGLINEGNVEGLTPLHEACTDLNLQLIETLLNHKADCNVIDRKGQTPLHCVVNSVPFPGPYGASKGFFSFSHKMIRTLIKHGADCNIRTLDTRLTAVHCICRNSAFFDVELLEDVFAVADITVTDIHKNTCLHYMFENLYGNSALMDYLSEKYRFNPVLSVANRQGLTPLHMLAIGGSIFWYNDVFRTHLHDTDRLQRSLIHLFCESSQWRFSSPQENCSEINNLIESVDFQNRTALHHLCITFRQTGIPDSLVEVLSHQVTAKDKFGRTPLHYAAMYQNMEFYWLLANMPYEGLEDMADEDGITPKDIVLAIDARIDHSATIADKVMAFSGISKFDFQPVLKPNRVLTEPDVNGGRTLEVTFTCNGLKVDSPYYKITCGSSAGGNDSFRKDQHYQRIGITSDLFRKSHTQLLSDSKDNLTRTLLSAVETFVRRLMETIETADKRFKSEYKLVGSSSENSKSSHANDFDVAIILTEFQNSFATVDFNDTPGYLRLRLNEPSPGKFAEFCDRDSFLLPSVVKEQFNALVIEALGDSNTWMDGVFEYLTASVQNRPNTASIILSLTINRLRSGSSVFVHNGGSNVSVIVDLVPAICTSESLPDDAEDSRFFTTSLNSRNCTKAFAVLKTPKKYIGIKNYQQMFRVSYMLVESEMLKLNPQTINTAYKLLKLLYFDRPRSDSHTDRVSKYTLKICTLSCMASGDFDGILNKDEPPEQIVKECFHVLLGRLWNFIRNDAVQCFGYITTTWTCEPIPLFYKYWKKTFDRLKPKKHDDDRFYRGLQCQSIFHRQLISTCRSTYRFLYIQETCGTINTVLKDEREIIKYLHSLVEDVCGGCELSDQLDSAFVDTPLSPIEEKRCLRIIANGWRILGLLGPPYHPYSVGLQAISGRHILSDNRRRSRRFESYDKWL